jgi:ATP-binding cassette, subfamily C (CFTR/MRP), member 4
VKSVRLECYAFHVEIRIGAGKSSLFQGLLRLVDRSAIDGEILIDDIDISRIPLSQLRSHISIIPQHPVIFAGTIRSNLDPLDIYSDEQCWIALEDVQLKELVSNHPNGLLMPMAERGSNLSIGQCQMICICRAILKPSRILLIDEATANIDYENDRALQVIIAHLARNRTVLTIAHRLSSVMSNDRILALDSGMIVDFDETDSVLSRFR